MHDLVEQLKREVAAISGASPAPRRRRRAIATKPTKVTKVKTFEYNRVSHGLTGKQTKAYTVAVLRVLGVLTVKRATVSKSALVAFFNSDGLIRYHENKGNIESIDSATFRLTDEGLEFFRGRIELKEDITKFERAIRKGEECGYPLRTITITK